MPLGVLTSSFGAHLGLVQLEEDCADVTGNLFKTQCVDIRAEQFEDLFSEVSQVVGRLLLDVSFFE